MKINSSASFMAPFFFSFIHSLYQFPSQEMWHKCIWSPKTANEAVKSPQTLFIFFFSEAAALKPNKCWELNSTALNQAAVSSWLNVEGERVRERERERQRAWFGFSNTSPNTRAPSCACAKCVKRDEEMKGSHRRNWQRGRRTTLGGTLGWTLSGSFRRMAWPIDGVLLSSTDSLIKDLEDDNRLDRGLCAVPPPPRCEDQGRPGRGVAKRI